MADFLVFDLIDPVALDLTITNYRAYTEYTISADEPHLLTYLTCLSRSSRSY